MKKKNYIKYHIGKNIFNCHIDAVHAQSPNSDQYTGEIVEAVIAQGDYSGIIATVSRTEMDINRPRSNQNAPAIDEFREAIKEILQSKKLLDKRLKLTKNYLHLAIHGMRDDRETVFEIGTRNGNSCSTEVQNWFIGELKSLTKNIGANSIFPGDTSKSYHRNGDPNSNYEGYGSKFHTIQIEINRTWRMNKQKEIVKFLSQIMNKFDSEFNKEESQ